MKIECFEFRSRLRDALAVSPTQEPQTPGTQPDVQALGWHAHLLSCAACRQLLESEQALDELLVSLPKPHLLEARRTLLLQRLGVELQLENLLALADPFQAAPSGLVERVRARVAEQSSEKVQDEALEDWLARVDRIEAPAGLAQRILAHCLSDQAATGGYRQELPQLPVRRPHGVPLGRKVVLRHWLPTSLVAAGLAALLWYLPGIQNKQAGPSSDSLEPDTQVAMDPKEEEAAPEMLAVLDSLEVLHMVDELNAEEWDLLDEYDRLGLFLLEDTTDGAPLSNGAEQGR